jgi:hypothetical protein
MDPYVAFKSLELMRLAKKEKTRLRKKSGKIKKHNFLLFFPFSGFGD